MTALRVKNKTAARSRQVEAMTPPEALRAMFAYDPETGDLTRRTTGRLLRRSGGRYLQVSVSGIYLSAHRVIWCIQTGAWPTSEVDHKDGDPRNNRWSNLREASPQQNSQWARAPRGATGQRGIGRHGKGFRVRIGIGARGVRENVGTFPTLEEAVQARKDAEAKLWGCR